MRKIYRVVVVLLMMWIVLLPVKASEKGSIRIRLNVGDLPVINGAFTVCHVGSPISDGYRIDGEFGGGFVRGEDADSPHLAQWLSDQEVEKGVTVLLDADGNGLFSDLEDGLYLMTQTESTDGFYPIQPFLLAIPGTEGSCLSINLDPLPIVADAPPTAQDAEVYFWALGMYLSLSALLYLSWRRKHW